MKIIYNSILWPMLLSALSVSSLLAEDDDDHHAEEGFSEQAAFGFDLSEGWFEPSEHSHVSPLGTPMAHPFRLEPASIHSDLFVDYGFRKGGDGNEHEIEMELELALTRRIGLVVEVPYAFIESGAGSKVDGFGDVAIAPRFLLAQYDKFSLAFNFEVELATGDEGRGLGGGEVAYAPSFSTWHDLGNWWVLNTQTGLESSSSSNELFILASLIHTFGRREAELAQGDEEGHDHGHKHSTKGLVSLILEVDSRIGLSGDAGEGVVGMEGIFGAYYGLNEDFSLRLGYQFPITSPREFDGGLILGGMWLF